MEDIMVILMKNHSAWKFIIDNNIKFIIIIFFYRRIIIIHSSSRHFNNVLSIKGLANNNHY